MNNKMNSILVLKWDNIYSEENYRLMTEKAHKK